jgi:hypothetical protein
MATPSEFKLLGAPYTPPRVKRGDRAFCLLRDCDVVITRWTDARIPWPRCTVPRRGGGSGLLIDEELARAIRTESAEAIKYWFGIGTHGVWNWRKAFEVKHWGTPGSQRLQLDLIAKASAVTRGKKLPKAAVEERRGRATRLNLGRFLKHGYHGPRWTEEQLALLGTMCDEDVAARTGKSTSAVRQRRTRLGIRTFKDRRRNGRFTALLDLGTMHRD